jgi:hypothetical protein
LGVWWRTASDRVKYDASTTNGVAPSEAGLCAEPID